MTATTGIHNTEDGETIQILHVDDEPDFADLAASFLEQEDDRLTVQTTTSADEGLTLLAESDVDGIISDYEMPGQNGIEFLETVREEYPDLPFILFTGKGSEEVASEAIARDVTDYLQKGSGTQQYELLANRTLNAVQQCRATQRAENLERIQSVLRDVNQAIVRAQTRDEIESRVCEIISEADPYCFAWIGEHDPDSKTVQPRGTAGTGEGYLDAIDVTTDESATGRGPTGRAIRTRELSVMQNIPESDEYEPWREDAIERGYQSSAAIPLIHDYTLYGVLNVYADRTHAFDDREKKLLEELADDVANAISHAETRSQQRRYERIIENLPIGVYRATPGTNGQILDANHALAEIFGAESPGEMIGREVTDFYKEPEERVELSQQLRDEGIVHEVELRQETLTGDDIWVAVTAMHTEEDGEVYFDGIIRDTTERKERERQLRLFENAVEASGHSVYFAETDGTIEYVNPAFEELTGYTADEAIGENPRILRSGEHDEEFYEELWETILSGDVWRNEIINETKSGEQYVADQTIAPLEDENGEITHFIAINIDITERREFEETITRQNKRLEKFIETVSHDLRGPLRVAEGQVELAQQDCDSEHLQKAEEALDRGETLLEELLTLAQQGETVDDVDRIELATLAERCWRTSETANATLVTESDSTIQADESRLKELLENLYGNAVTHGGADVTVTVGELADGFYVEDDGVGIPPADREQVFEAGYSTDSDGTGFGLGIVKEIINAHGWNIRVTEGSDGGARFEITGVEFAAE